MKAPKPIELRAPRDPFAQTIRITTAIRTAASSGATIEVCRCPRAGTTTILRFPETMRAERQAALAKVLGAAGFNLLPDRSGYARCSCLQGVLAC